LTQAASGQAAIYTTWCTAFISGIKQRRAELRAQREELERQIAKAQEQAQDTRDPALLDHLPVAVVDLDGMLDDQSRRLFEALRLEIRYHPATRMADCSVTLSGDTIDAVSRSTRGNHGPDQARG
jgi:site-specific DNA recombinase